MHSTIMHISLHACACSARRDTEQGLEHME